MGVGVLVWVDGWCLDRSMRVQLCVRDVFVMVGCAWRLGLRCSCSAWGRVEAVDAEQDVLMCV